MKQKIKVTILLIMFLVSFSRSYSQEIKHFKQNLNAFILKFDTTKNLANKDNVKDVLSKKLSLLSKDNELLSTNSNDIERTKDDLGLTHERFVQYYKGIKVEGSDIRVHYKGKVVVSVNGEYANTINLDVNPVLLEEEAITQAKGFINAKKYRWEIPEENAWLQEVTSDKNLTFFPKAELVICRNRLNPLDSAYHLAYKVNISAIEPMSDSFVFVDAKAGLILNNLSTIRDLNGTAKTRYNSDIKTIQTLSASPSYILKDITRGNYIVTKNMQKGTVYSNTVEFTDNNNDWTASEFHNANKDDAALDAHWGIMMTYDYFKNVHNRFSYDNNGAIIRNYIHYSFDWANAEWVGNPINILRYGDGNDTLDAFTCLDITAHEFAHAICEHTANLIYSSESGAINESLSDIWGACVEHYAAPSKSMWENGEDIVLNGNSAIRSMLNPNLYGQPDTYGGTYWFNTSGCTPIGDPRDPNYNDNCGVHRNSGVMNHWFYILVNGKNSTNDLGDPFNVKGIGIDKAAKIVYHTENQFWTPGSGFNYARDLSIDTAAGLYQNYSSEVVEVTNAWYAVGVGDEFSCDDWMYIFAEDYTSNTTIAACNIELYDVTVTNGATLTLDVAKDALISGPFEVALGSQFEVK